MRVQPQEMPTLNRCVGVTSLPDVSSSVSSLQGEDSVRGLKVESSGLLAISCRDL